MQHETIIRPPEKISLIGLRELIGYRGVLITMAQRKIKAEFGDVKLGLFWVLARPLLMTVIFVWFKHVAQAQIGVSVPYMLYLYSGFILWFFFAESVSRVAAAINSDAGLMKKIYFPRLISPLSGVMALFAGFMLSLVPLICMMAYHQIWPGMNLILLPVLLLQVMLLALGVGCIFAVLGQMSKDWERLLSLLLYIGLFISPVIYAPDMLPTFVKQLHAINPMSGILLGFRACLFAPFAMPFTDWILSLVITLLIVIIGLYSFARAERYFMDRL